VIKLIGNAFNKGRIQRIDAGMKQSQADRILVDPSQARVELVSAPVNEGQTPEWMEEMESILRSADSMYLQFKSGVLRFRRATHDAGSNRQFVTLGNQDEFDLYSQEHWQRIRYFYATHRLSTPFFDVNTLISHKATGTNSTTKIELPARLDFSCPSGDANVTFSATGSEAAVEIVEWRGKVKEGETGRYAPENSHIVFSVNQVHRPFTFLHEDRREFHNHSYTFTASKTRDLLKRIVKRKLAALEKEITEGD
jgi:hypothetical protein